MLDGVDLRLAPGRAVAIAGPSGAGKTTLAELLVRFRDPTAGSVAIGGADLRGLDPGAVRDVVRLGAQEAYLFATSIGANVALARPGAGADAIAEALAAVGLEPWLRSLPDGLDTQVGEAGAQVSGGQRQRIAAARLLLCDARFLDLRRADDAPRPGGRGGAAHAARRAARASRAAACSSSRTSAAGSPPSTRSGSSPGARSSPASRRRRSRASPRARARAAR